MGPTIYGTMKFEKYFRLMLRNYNLPALLVGISNGAGALENTLAVPQNVKHRVTI